MSKAVLRAAIDEVHRSVADANFFYFPAYEVVMSGFRTPFGGDLRHPYDYVLDANMKAFEYYFCTTGLTEADLQNSIRKALDADGALTMGEQARFRQFVHDRQRAPKKEEAVDAGYAFGLKRRQANLARRRATAPAAISSALAAGWAAIRSAFGATRDGRRSPVPRLSGTRLRPSRRPPGTSASSRRVKRAGRQGSPLNSGAEDGVEAAQSRTGRARTGGITRRSTSFESAYCVASVRHFAL